jgi:hypothetical protein
MPVQAMRAFSIGSPFFPSQALISFPTAAAVEPLGVDDDDPMALDEQDAREYGLEERRLAEMTAAKCSASWSFVRGFESVRSTFPVA